MYQRPTESKERSRARKREKYRDDAEYRARVIATTTAWSKKNKEKRKAIQKRSDEKHADRKLATSRAWWKSHPEAKEKYAANKNPEAEKKRAAEYRRLNPDKRRQACKSWRTNNKEAHAAYNKQFWQTHKDYAAIKSQNRRARLKANGGELSDNIISVLSAEQGGKCSYCFCDLSVTGHHLDHVMPISLGGRNDDSNVQLLCPPCNLSKNAKHPLVFMRIIGLFPMIAQG